MPVYEYEGKHFELPDGLTNEQAIATIEEHLGGTQVAEAPKEPNNPLLHGWGIGMRPVIEAASFPMNAVADGAAGVFNAGANLVGSDVRAPYLSKMQAEGLNAREYEGQKVYPEASTLGEKIVQGTTGALAGAIGFGGVAPKMIPSTAGTLASTVVGGASAPAIHDKTKEFTGSDVAATVASLGVSAVLGGLSGKGVDSLFKDKSSMVTMEEVKKRAQDAYRTVDQSGVAIRPTSAQAMVNQVQAALLKEGYRPKVYPRVEKVLETLKEDIGTQRVSFSQLEQLRGVANSLKSDPDKSVQRMGGILIRELDDRVASFQQKDLMPVPGSTKADFDKALEAVQSARKDWRALSKASLLEDVLDIAEIKSAKPTASEAELIRDGFIRIATDKRKMAQFSKEEQAAILKVTKGIPMDGTLGQVARLNPARAQMVGLGPMAVVGAGATTGSPLAVAGGLAASGLGFGADKLQQSLRSGQAKAVIADILSGKSKPTEQDLHMLRGLFGGTVNLQDR